MMTTEPLYQSELLPPLLGIGFSKNEALVYLACLELGPSTVWDIAEKSGIKRPTCYVLLNELLLKGYAHHQTDGKRAIYSVSSPKHVLRSTERRQERFAATVSRLEALAERSGKRPGVSFFEGVQGVRDAYLGSLDVARGTEILFLGSDALTEEFYLGLLAEYMRIRQKRQIPIRVIFEDNEANRRIGPDDATRLRQTRYLDPTAFQPIFEQHIAGDKVLFISHAGKAPYAMVIEEVNFARQERQKFELLWGVAGE